MIFNTLRGVFIKIGCFLLLNCSLFLLTTLALPLSKEAPVRNVNVKVALSSELKATGNCAHEILALMRDCNWTFKRRFGIRFQIKKIEYWRYGSSTKTLKTCLDRMKTKVLPGECDIVLGFIPPNLRRNEVLGIANYFQGYLLLRYFQSYESMKFLLLHELCHMFGAVDIEEPGSLMNISKPGLEIDDFTSQVIRLNRLRLFHMEEFPLPDTQVAEVISIFEKRTRLGRREPAVRQNMAFFYLETRNFSAALNECVYLLENYPELKMIHNTIANIYLRQDRFEEASSEYEKALCYYPHSPDIHFNLALAYFKRGLIGEAVSGYRKALDLNPNYPKAHAYLALLYFRQKKIDEAMTECRLALNLCPKYTQALCLYAAIIMEKYNYLSNGDAQYEESARIYSGNSSRNILLQEAKDYCLEALSSNTRSAEAHNILGIINAYQDKSKEAELEFLKALEINPSFIHAHYNLGRLYVHNNRPDKAAYHLKKIIEINTHSGGGLEIIFKIITNQKRYSISLGSQKF